MSSPTTSISPPILGRAISPRPQTPTAMLPRSRPPRPQSNPSPAVIPTSNDINPRPNPRHAHSNPISSSSDATTSSNNPLTPETSLSPSTSSSQSQTQSHKPRKNSSTTSLPTHTPQNLPRNSRTQPSTAASSTTSVNGLLAMSMSMTAGAVAATPQTGASRMAMAAKRGQQGRDSGLRGEVEGLPGISASRAREDEEHPLSDKSLTARGYQTIHTMSTLFHLPLRWSLIRPLGQGAYGLVISVQDSLSGEPVAVKCITRVFDKVILARRALREITLLRHFQGHENLTGLIDLDNVWDGYNEIYLYMEPMEADLHQIVRSGQALSNSHVQFFLYQLLRGMKYIHSANVIHRDLKPGNLLVNADCELKICDFGLARGYKPVKGEADQQEEMKLTEYVATRWYRAPEIMLSNRRYTTAIDVWSIGCILAELLGGKPIFKGKDYVDQLNLIIGVLGTPDDETLSRVGSEKACTYIKTLPVCEPVDLYETFPDADRDAVDLLYRLLDFDPTTRITVEEALKHPYVAAYHDPGDEPVCDELFEKWESVESLTTIEELREAITREINEFRAEVRECVDDDEEASEEEVLNGEGWTGSGEYTLSPKMGEGSTRTSPEKGGLSPAMAMSSLGLSPGSSTHPLPLSPANTNGGTSLPPVSRKDRDGSPATPLTALSEDSFGNPVSGRSSRRQSSHSMHRRPTSFLFSPFSGMTPLPTNTNVMNGISQSMILTSTANGNGNGSGQPGDGYFMHRTPRSRAASSNMGDSGGLRPLLRQLSTVNLAELGKEKEGEGGSSEQEVPPMTVSPSDAPPSEVPKNFTKLTEEALA